jgi:hypothetical protein
VCAANSGDGRVNGPIVALGGFFLGSFESTKNIQLFIYKMEVIHK